MEPTLEHLLAAVQQGAAAVAGDPLMVVRPEPGECDPDAWVEWYGGELPA